MGVHVKLWAWVFIAVRHKVTQAKLAVCAAWYENPKNPMGKKLGTYSQPNAVAQTFGG